MELYEYHAKKNYRAVVIAIELQKYLTRIYLDDYQEHKKWWKNVVKRELIKTNQTIKMKHMEFIRIRLFRYAMKHGHLRGAKESAQQMLEGIADI